MAKRKGRRKKSETEPPTCNTLLLCDDVLISQGKDKHFLHGVIGRVTALDFPTVMGGFVAYVRVSNVYPAQKLHLNFAEAATDEILFQIEANFPEQAEPLGVYTIVVPIRPFVVHRPGRYMFSAVSAGGSLLAMSPIQVLGINQAREGDAES